MCRKAGLWTLTPTVLTLNLDYGALPLAMLTGVGRKPSSRQWRECSTGGKKVCLPLIVGHPPHHLVSLLSLCIHLADGL